MYIVEGNIGAGKSTFLTLMQEYMPEAKVWLEPLHDWQGQIYGQSLLTNFYKEPKRWAYTLETLTLMCRVKEQLIHQQTMYPTQVIERSIYSGHYCFAKNGFEHDFLTPLEWQMYQEWFIFLTDILRAPKGFIYLRVSPEVSYERIKKRNRLSEKKLSLQYLRQIYDKHEAFLIEKSVAPHLRNVPVLTLDCDQEFEQDPDYLSTLMARVSDFIDQGALLYP